MLVWGDVFGVITIEEAACSQLNVQTIDADGKQRRHYDCTIGAQQYIDKKNYRKHRNDMQYLHMKLENLLTVCFCSSGLCSLAQYLLKTYQIVQSTEQTGNL